MTRCPECGEQYQIGDWPFCGPTGHRRSYLSTGQPWHPNETSVVFEHPLTGDIKYTGRNDQPIPERYAKAGYVRKEIRSDREMQQFERSHGVRNERTWFDKGSGRSFDNDGRM